MCIAGHNIDDRLLCDCENESARILRKKEVVMSGQLSMESTWQVPEFVRSLVELVSVRPSVILSSYPTCYGGTKRNWPEWCNEQGKWEGCCWRCESVLHRGTDEVCWRGQSETFIRFSSLSRRQRLKTVGLLRQWRRLTWSSFLMCSEWRWALRLEEKQRNWWKADEKLWNVVSGGELSTNCCEFSSKI